MDMYTVLSSEGLREADVLCGDLDEMCATSTLHEHSLSKSETSEVYCTWLLLGALQLSDRFFSRLDLAYLALCRYVTYLTHHMYICSQKRKEENI